MTSGVLRVLSAGLLLTCAAGVIRAETPPRNVLVIANYRLDLHVFSSQRNLQAQSTLLLHNSGDAAIESSHQAERLVYEHPVAQTGDAATCDRYRYAPEPPYVLKFSAPSGGTLTYIGVAHTMDISSPSIAAIERQWNEARPTIAFSEGGVWPLADSREIAVLKWGEGGFVRFLAEHAGVPTKSLEPPASEQTATLLRSFSPEQLKLFYVLRQVQQHRRGSGGVPPDSVFESIISGVARDYQLEGKPVSVAELERLVGERLPELKNWRAVPESYFVPFESASWTNTITCMASQFRDRYMVSLLTKAVESGEHVFAVVGVGHLATQESILNQKLKPVRK